MRKNGYFIISLDFELLWGMFDSKTSEEFLSRSLGAREAIPLLLKLFEKYDIHATWGIVGLLFADNLSEMKKYYPDNKPNYLNKKLSAFDHLNCVGENEEIDKVHFASNIIDIIKKFKNQEIASHTFSHYYCKELGQNIETFRCDIESAKIIAKEKKDITLQSLILPRNQFRDDYANVAKECGFTSIRGNSKHYAYNNSTMLAKIIRLLDSYINICGFKCYKKNQCFENGIVNIRASRFFRQYDERLSLFEGLKLRCIKKQMKYAAKTGKIFHLWWHPHNMGHNTDINLKQLEELFVYYKKLNKKYSFVSKNMKEFAGESFNENSASVR